jgi:uncharacterized membrane protein required for colicin V production
MIDILALGVFARGFYVGRRSGFISELLRLAGIIFSTFVILHYYFLFGSFLKERFFIPATVNDFAAFAVLMVTAIVVFFLIREGWLIVFKVEVKSAVNKWGGSILSFATSLLTCSLLLLALTLLNNSYINQHLKDSLSRGFLKNPSVIVYKACHKMFVYPFFPDEPVNAKAIKLAEESP